MVSFVAIKTFWMVVMEPSLVGLKLVSVEEFATVLAIYFIFFLMLLIHVLAQRGLEVLFATDLARDSPPLMVEKGLISLLVLPLFYWQRIIFWI